jgi:chromate reductase, NAD(P)H dehydrogenase (quinone)
VVNEVSLAMSASFDVAAFVGSLRRDSYTRSLLRALAGIAPPALKIDIVDVSDLTFYNQDLEVDPPQPWMKLRERIKRADAVLFATAEYNRSVPPVLKNLIDIGSRPVAANAWSGKPGAVVSASPGVMGAFGASQHLRQVLMSVNVPTLQSPEVYLGGVGKLLDAEDKFTNPSTAEFGGKFLSAFETWIRKLKA